MPKIYSPLHNLKNKDYETKKTILVEFFSLI